MFPHTAEVLDNMLQALSMVFNVLVLAAGFMLIFAVFGLYIFNGVLRGRCAVGVYPPGTPYNETVMDLAHPERFCDITGLKPYAWPCPAHMSCVTHENPHGNYQGFDNFAFALLTVVTTVTMEGWSAVMYQLQEGGGDFWAVIYFVFMVVLFSHVILALIMAALSDIFGSGARLRTMRSALDAVEGEEALDEMRSAVGDPKKLKEIEDRVPDEGSYNPFASLQEGVQRLDWLLPRQLPRDQWDEHLNQVDQLVAEENEVTARFDEAFAKAQELATAETPNGHVYELPDDCRLLQELDSAKEAKLEATSKVTKKALTWDYIRWTVESEDFEFISYVLIFSTIASQTVEASVADTSSTVAVYANRADDVCCGLFILEVLTRILGCRTIGGYLKQSHNQLDLVLGFLGVVELIGSFGSFSAPAFRILRLISLSRSSRLIYRFEGLRVQVVTALQSARSLAALMGITALFIYFWAVIGHNIFCGLLDSNSRQPHFNTFQDSFLTMFIVFTGEDWIVPFYNLLPKAPVTSVLYFISFFWISNWVVMQLIVAVFLENFEKDEQVKFEQQKRAWLARLNRAKEQESVFGQVLNLAKALPRLRTWMDKSVWGRAKVHPLPDVPSFGGPDNGGAGKEGHETGGEQGEGHKGDEEAGTVGGNSEKPAQLNRVGSYYRRFSTALAGEQGDDDNKHKLTISDEDVSYWREHLNHDAMLSYDHPWWRTRYYMRKFTMYPLGELVGTMEHQNEKTDFRLSEDDVDHEEDPTKWKLIERLEQKSVFEMSMLLVIMVNVVYLLSTPPRALSEGTTLNDWDISFLVIFTVEFVLKVGAHGFYQHVTLDQQMIMLRRLHHQHQEDNWASCGTEDEEGAIKTLKATELQMACLDFIVEEHSNNSDPPEDDRNDCDPYIRTNWNRMDLGVLICLYISLIMSFFSNNLLALNHVTLLRSIRAARVLAAVKLLRVFTMSREIVNPLARVMVYILPTFLPLLAMALFSFGLMGVSLFRGKLEGCTDNTQRTSTGCLNLYQNDMGFYAPRVWDNPYFDFDTIGGAMLSLTQALSLETWVDMMYLVMERTEWAACLYFLVFITVVAVFVMQLLQGIIIQKFNEARSEALFTWKQTIWNTTKQYITDDSHLENLGSTAAKVTVLEEGGWIASKCTALKANIVYDNCLNVIVLVHVCFVCAKHYGQSESYTDMILYVDWVCLSLYIVDACLSLLTIYNTRSWHRFLQDRHQLFDVATVLILIATQLVHTTSISSDADGIGAVMRSFRVIVIVRGMYKYHGLRIILNTFTNSLPSWVGVILLQFCAITMFGILGREVFHAVRYGQHLNEHANFKTIGSTIMLLFRCLTGEAWPLLMVDAMVSPPNCTEGLDCGNRFATAYFVLFFLLVTCILWQLFTAIVLEHFSFCYNSLITTQDLLDFQKLWKEYAQTEEELRVIREEKDRIDNEAYRERIRVKALARNDEEDEEEMRRRRMEPTSAARVRSPSPVGLHRATSQRILATDRIDPMKSRFGSIIAPDLSEQEIAMEGFLELGRYDDDQGGLRSFLRTLGPPFSLNAKNTEVAGSWYQKIYSQVEAVRERDNCVSYWHLLETLIIARLGIDALPNTRLHDDRSRYMRRVVHVLNRTSACEKIQAMWHGMRCRSTGGELSRLIPEKDMPIILRARGTVLFLQQLNGSLEGNRKDEKTRSSKEIGTIWKPEVTFQVKRCGYVSMPTHGGDVISAPRSNDPCGKGSAVMIKRVIREEAGLAFEINHPIVLVKNYFLQHKKIAFSKDRLELSIERLLQYSGHDITIKEELADLTCHLLNLNGIKEPFLLDIRMMLTKVLSHTVL